MRASRNSKLDILTRLRRIATKLATLMHFEADIELHICEGCQKVKVQGHRGITYSGTTLYGRRRGVLDVTGNELEIVVTFAIT